VLVVVESGKECNNGDDVGHMGWSVTAVALRSGEVFAKTFTSVAGNEEDVRQ
jgi:hypothetical protein